MNWLQEWKAISAHITGLIKASSVFYGAQENYSTDDMSVRKTVLLRSAENILKRSSEFCNEYKDCIPQDAFEFMRDFLNQDRRNSSISILLEIQFADILN